MTEESNVPPRSPLPIHLSQNMEEMKMNIRLENKQDFYTVELLTRDAFWGEFEPGCV